MSEITGISVDLIAELMANSRNRNVYGPKLIEFMESDEAGINPAEVWPLECNGKASSVYQGFITAVKKAELQDVVMVKRHEESVFLIHRERAGLAVTEAAAQAA
jgi:hypothetical protein